MPAERILVVDDSPTQLEAARALLEGNGFKVETSHSGEDALIRAASTRFDVVLSDVVMPGINGYDLCARLKRELTDPPAIVLLTTLADPRDIVRGVECGADNYITKPYDPEHLLARIDHVLENRRLQRETQPGEPARISFLGETYTITSEPTQILALLLSSFEELIRTNEALDESKRRAEAATRARDDVLATVSHDLRNPVGTIFTSATLLLDMPLSPEAQQRQLEIIRRTAQRMDRLIQDLLDVSRMEAGRFSVEQFPESVRSLVLEASEALGSMATHQGVTLVEELPADDVRVQADRVRVLQVFSNLIGNAIKFTPGGGSITVRVSQRGDAALFEIADTGKGIAPENLPRIFDRFWHGGESAGTGLGLAIAKGIVEAHGGRIWARSSERGSTFAFTLPLAPESARLQSSQQQPTR